MLDRTSIAEKYRKKNLRHSFHILGPSAWPFLTSLSLLFLAFGTLFYLHGIYVLIPGFCWMTTALWLFLFSLAGWWGDVIKESTYERQHTVQVMQGIRIGMLLFILSEVMFFFAFFWAFFHSSLSPAMGIGFVWPPKGIAVINPWGLPLFNTLLLLCSGAAITTAHNCLLMGGDSFEVYEILQLTGLMGVVFLLSQWVEYREAAFTIADGIYGSLFYMTTGFHGIHVLVGTIFIFVCSWRAKLSHFDSQYHVGLECAIWYWHFVDIVWLFLFLVVYMWGSR